MATRYGRSPWVDRVSSARVAAYRAQRGQLSVDVAIVGGGLTGCTTAYAFAAAGVRVALVEAGRLGRAASGSSIGWIADEPGADFIDVERGLGLKKSRLAWKAWRRGALDLASLARRLGISCRLEPRSTMVLARTSEQAVGLVREFKARHRAGLEVSALTSRVASGETAIAADAAFRTRSGATADPYRLLIGLARAAAQRGALLFERSPARRITSTPGYVDVVTGGGAIRAQCVIVATGMPTPLFKSLQRHFHVRSAFMVLTEPVPGKVRRGLGDRSSVIRDSAVPPHVLRWVDGDRMLVSGADTAAVAPRVRDKVIVQRTGQLMYELSTIYPDISGLPPAYGWEAAYARTVDGLPYIGRHRNFPRHLFSFGDSSRGMTGAYLASRILLRQYLDQPEPSDPVFGFTR